VSEVDDFSDLPGGWISTTIGVIARVNPRKPAYNAHDDTDEVGFIPMAAVDAVSGTVSAVEVRTLGEVRSKSFRTFEPGDVLFAKITPCMENGKSAIVPDLPNGLGFGSTEFHVLRTNGSVDPEYLWRFVRQESYRKIAESHMTGSVGQLRVPPEFVRETVIPLPPLDWQRRILDYIGAVDSHRESVAARLAAARGLLDRLRPAVLGAEFAELASETPLLPLEAILAEPLKNGYSASPVSRVTPTRVLTLTATTSGYFNPAHFKYTDEEIPPGSPLWLEPGDVLVQRGNTAELVGMPALYDGRPGEFIYPDLMIRARVSDDVDPRYVWYMLLAPQSRAFLRDRAIGTAGNMPKINQKTLNAVPLPVPSKEAQEHVIRRVSAALEGADRLAQAISAAEASLERASRSALALAFRGELGTTDASRIIAKREPPEADPDRSAIASV
jgi:type I restriction enzyme S subunit